MQKTNFKSAWSIMMLAVLSAFMSISFQSCSKDDDGGGDTDATSVVGKWTVANPSDNGYGSFEFTDDQKYIITQRTTTPPARSASVRASETVYIIIIFGDISSLKGSGNEYTLDLEKFGIIKIKINTKGAATITVDGETYTTKKEEEVKVSAKTELLCHTWNVNYYDEYDEVKEWTVTFSKNGTYLWYIKEVYGPDGNKTVREDYDYGTWEWTDSNETEIYVTEPDEYYEDGIYWCFIKIVELTDKYMKLELIKDSDGDAEDVDTDYINEYYRD